MFCIYEEGREGIDQDLQRTSIELRLTYSKVKVVKHLETFAALCLSRLPDVFEQRAYLLR